MDLRPRFVLLLLALLSAGCMTGSYLSKDEPAPDDATVVFHLHDSTHITSSSGKHRRIEEGYEVIGTFSSKYRSEDSFEGIILDDDLTGISVEKYNPTGTALLIVGVGVVLLLILTRWGHGGP